MVQELELVHGQTFFDYCDDGEKAKHKPLVPRNIPQP